MEISGNNYAELISNLIEVFKADIRDIVFETVKDALSSYKEETSPQKLFSVNDVVKLFGISKVTLWDHTKKGYIVATKIGRRTMYSETAINDYLAFGRRRQKYDYDIVTKERKKKEAIKTYIMKDDSTGCYKIGKSIAPKYRESTLQCEKPTVHLLFVYSGDIESRIHQKYAQYRIRGEWFRLGDLDLENIVTHYGFERVQPDCL